MGKYFGTDGIRGEANVGLSAQRAFEVGRYLGYYFSQNGRQRILIGKDTRRSSDMLEAALAAGIAAQGCDVCLASYCPTPMTAYLVTKEDFACAAMVSASHNPFYDNGIKVFSKEGIKLPADIENLIEDYLDGRTTLDYSRREAIGRIVPYPQGLEHYLSWLQSIFPLDLHGVKILADTCHGSACFTAPELLKRLGADLTVINRDPDGLNINTGCGSTHPEMMQAEMRKGCYDLGLAFDGDADRMIMADAEGNLLTGDHVLYASGRYLAAKGRLNNRTVVTTTMANLGLSKALAEEDIQVVQTQVGDKYVYERMCQDNDVVGGEQSGHIIYKEYETTGDGLVTALFYLQMMLDTGSTAAQLAAGLKIYPQVLINVRVKDKNVVMQDDEVQAAVAAVAAQLGSNGRILVRPSGTEPLIRVMAEAETTELCQQVTGKVADLVRQKYGI